MSSAKGKKRSSSAWKEAEKKVARRLKAERLGGCRRDLPDARHPLLNIEVKYRKNPIKALLEILAEAKLKGKKEKIDLGAFKFKNFKREIVVMWLDEFQDLFGKIKT